MMSECAVTVVIQTPRLRLRTLDPEHDADAMLELVNDPGFIAGINDRGIRTCEQARASARLGAGPPCATVLRTGRCRRARTPRLSARWACYIVRPCWCRISVT
ncbi:conserved hypothetical protein [Xanthomonas oryzae pv. oryzae MAFF 311018]|nr:conserved hypothetical protein [Xanthomonas oryzae pv. oryzae MAFF 311018]